MRHPCRSAFAALSLSACASLACAAQTQSFVISWFSQATNSSEHDCSGGVHPEVEQIYLRYAERMDIAPEKIKLWRQEIFEGKDDTDMQNFVGARGRIGGKPANPYSQPASVIDLNLPAVDGKYAFGFDLDGKGASDPKGFEDPETHERGVDNQLYRALGCVRAFRGTLEGRPTYYAWAWGQLKDSQPAWLIRISADNLSHDGPVTIRIDRAFEHLRSNADGSPRRDVAYRLDPDTRSHNVFRGELKGGVVSVTDHHDFWILQNPLTEPQLDLHKFHLRLNLQGDGTSRGFLAGYQPWHSIYWGIAGIGIGGEQQVTGDIPQLYHLMKRYADSDPDPASGQNMRISATYYFEAVPAFVSDGAP